MTDSVPDAAQAAEAAAAQAAPSDAPFEAAPAATTEGAAPAAGVASAPASEAARPAVHKPRRGGRNAPPSSPRQTLPVLERLFQLYPKLFGARFLPLKLGVFQDLLERHPEDFKKDELKLALGQHARSTRYLESVAAGEKRHDLEGRPVEDVAPEHVHHAIMEVFRRRQARSKEDLRPWLQGRLVRAIEASGLEREAYLERIRGQDEAVLTALDAAFADIAERAARREALLRAYEASGKSAAEFAEMYGLDAATVNAALAARPAGSAI